MNGNVVTSVDANGNTTTNTYDVLNRVISTQVDAGSSAKNVSKAYEFDNMGKLTKTTVNGVETTYVYDSLGRLTEELGNFFKGYFYVGISTYVDRTVIGKNHLIAYSLTENTYDEEMRLQQVKEGVDITASYTFAFLR